MIEKLPIIKSKIKKEQLQQENPDSEIVSYLIPAVIFHCNKFDVLVELVTGGVVVDIESSNVINIPGLDEISMNELAILEQGFKLGEFTPNDFSLGLTVAKIESVLSDLLSKKLVTVSDKKYEVTDRFRILYHIEEYATKEKIIEEEVEGTKVEAKISIAQIKERISSIIRIESEDKCWIYYHKLK